MLVLFWVIIGTFDAAVIELFIWFAAFLPRFFELLFCKVAACTTKLLCFGM